MDIKQSSEKRFALLIDADNVSSKYIKPITDELSKYGTVTYKRIYGDWTLTLHARWKDALLENSITPIQQFGYTQGKNATDSAMIIDAMDILYTRSVEGFCIVSSDSDFTRLASRIRESGLTVIGMGEKKTPIPFRKACDIFTTLELLLGPTGNKNNVGNRTKSKQDAVSASVAPSTGTTISKDDIEKAVVNIITDNQNNGKSTGLGEVGSRLLKRYTDFDVRSYGTNLLSKLLDEFTSVKIIKDGSSVAVVLTEGATSSSAAAVATEPVSSALDEAAEPDRGDSSSRKAPRRNRRGGSKRSHASAASANSTDIADASETEVPSIETPQRDDKAQVKVASSRTRPAPGKTVRTPKNAPASDGAPQLPIEPAPRPGETPERFIRQIVRDSGAQGVALSALGKQVRAKYRTFKLRDLGYTQLRSYVADLGDIEVEKRDKDFYARLAE